MLSLSYLPLPLCRWNISTEVGVIKKRDFDDNYGKKKISELERSVNRLEEHESFK